MQDVATNFVTGSNPELLLVLQKPFEKGDKVRVHAGSTALEGIIHSIESQKYPILHVYMHIYV